MTFIVVSGFYPEPNPDNSLQYEKDVPKELEMDVLNAMVWTPPADIPPGVTDLTDEQAAAVMRLLDDPVKQELFYCIARYR